MSTPCHRHVGVAFPEGPELLPFYENLAKRLLLPIPVSVTFTVLLKHTIFFIDDLRVRERGRGRRKNRRNRRTGRISDVKEEGAVERGRENRLARATKSSFDHAVKSFNMVDAFGLLPVVLSMTL